MKTKTNGDQSTLFHRVAFSFLGLVLGLTLAWVFAPKPSEGSQALSSEASPETEEVWTCSMHPQIRLPAQGLCPLCAMDLIPATKGSDQEGDWVLSISEAAGRRAALEEVKVERKQVAHELRLWGQVASNEQRVGTITARFSGRIHRLFVDVTGTQVRQGDPVVSLDSPELFTAQQELLEAHRSSQSGPESLRPTAKARWNAGKEKLRLWGVMEEQIEAILQEGRPRKYLELHAPMTGTVLEKHVVEGTYVKEGTPLFTVSDLTKVWVFLDVYESDLSWIRLGQPVDFRADAFPGKLFQGTIAFIQPTVDTKTRTIRVRVNADNDQGLLKPAMWVRATLYASLGGSGTVISPELKWRCSMHPEEMDDHRRDCSLCGRPLTFTQEGRDLSSVDEAPLTIPVTAPLLTGTRAVVYVAQPGAPGTYEGRQIELGPRAGDDYVVLSGLKEGERVVVNGAFKIDSELQIRGKTSMMNQPPPAVVSEPEPLSLPPAAEEHLRSLFEIYFLISRYLSEDDLSLAHQQARLLTQEFSPTQGSLLEASALFVYQSLAADGSQAVKAFLEARDLVQARVHFERLTEVMERLLGRFPLNFQGEVHRFHCPMAFDNRGAWWIQRGRDTRNPYFGSDMLRCYDLQERLSGEEDPPSDKTMASKEPLAPAQQQALPMALSHYFTWQSALAADDPQRAAAPMVLLAKVFSGDPSPEGPDPSRDPWSFWLSRWTSAWAGVSPADSLETMRSRFERVSLLFIELNRVFDVDWQREVFQFHCPMAFDDKGAPWLQGEANLLNPYFGSSMLRCGTLTEAWKGATHEP